METSKLVTIIYFCYWVIWWQVQGSSQVGGVAGVFYVSTNFTVSTFQGLCLQMFVRDW